MQTTRPILFALVGATLFASGCGDPVDPLARDRAALMAEANNALAAGWTPEATILIGQPLLQRQLEVALLAAVADATPLLKLEGQLGQMKLTPTLAVTRLSFAKSEGCADCVEVTAGLSGTVTAALERSAFGNFGISAPYNGEATATVEIAVGRTADASSASTPAASSSTALSSAVSSNDPARTILVIPQEGTWKVVLNLEGLPREISDEAQAVVQNSLQRAVREKRIQPIEVATLPTHEVADIKGLRVRPTPHGLAVDFAFTALKHGAATTPVAPGEGWVAHLPEGTLLGLAHAAALRAGVQDGWAPEPVGFVVDDDKFVLTLKMWRVKATPDFRTLEVEGRIRITEDGTVEVISDDVREVGESGGFTLDPVVLLTRAILLEEIRKGLSAVVPAEHTQRTGGQGGIRVKLERAVLESGRVELYGSAEMVRLAS